MLELLLYSEASYKLLSSQQTHPCASHIDNTTLADGTYELVPESKSEQREAQVNLTEVTEDPNPISEEPRSSYAPEHVLLFLNLCNLLLFLSICAFKFTGVDWNLSCIILGTDV